MSPAILDHDVTDAASASQANVRFGHAEPAAAPEERTGRVQCGEPLLDRLRLRHDPRDVTPMVGDDNRCASFDVTDGPMEPA